MPQAVETNAKILYLVNPDNPSGTTLDSHQIEQLIESLPPACLLLLDEVSQPSLSRAGRPLTPAPGVSTSWRYGVVVRAPRRTLRCSANWPCSLLQAYLELAPPESVPLVAADDLRVLRLRTFSKAYGLAGARIGYAIGALEIVSAFDKIRNHFGIGRISQAGALAALLDQDYLSEVRERVEESRYTLNETARACGLHPLPSATNFVTMDCGRDAAFARAVVAALVERDIFVRMPGAAPLDRCIRVSCAGHREMELFKIALPSAVDVAITSHASHLSHGK